MSNDGGGTGPKGRIIGGRYRLLERIGAGGMGTVWRALDELVEREVAVKQPRLPGDPEDESHQRAAHRLHREARAAARVDHPSAVSIHDVVVEDGVPWIVMELIRGESLHEVLHRGPLPPAEAARIGLAVIVHRDVKPANVLLGPHRRVVLTDFGIAHIQGEESLTVSGEFVGSLEFIAPERMSGRSAGPASDLWSLGVLLYAAVEGWSPFRRTTLESTLAAILAADPPEPKQAGPLQSLIVRLLVKDPAGRPGAEEVGAVLEAVTEGWPVPGPFGDGATAPQDASGLREFAEDAGTVRLGGAAGAGGVAALETPSEREPGPDREADADAGPASEAVAEPTPHEPATVSTSASTSSTSTPPPTPKPRARFLLRPIPVAVLGVILVGGTWFTASAFLADANGGVREMNPTYTSVPAVEDPSRSPSPSAETWTAHREKALNAVLFLPDQYGESAREGGPADPPRLVEYDEPDSDITLRLTQWDKAPRSPMAQAQQAHAGWDSYNGDARTQYTRTSFHGYEAVLADTTYDLDESPTRVMELMILTDDSRMYELRVDMPKGTPKEKKGTALFKGARDRLEIGK